MSGIFVLGGALIGAGLVRIGAAEPAWFLTILVGTGCIIAGFIDEASKRK